MTNNIQAQSAKNIGLNRSRFLGIVRSFHEAKVLVIGDFILDQFLWGKVHRISPEAPVPVVQVERESFMPGGALNVAHNISTLGGKVFPSGLLGRDLFGRMLLKGMKNYGVDTAGVCIFEDAKRPTIQKTRVIAHSQQVVRYDREVVKDLQPKEFTNIMKFVSRKIREVNCVILEDYGKGVITPQLIQAVVKLARQHKKHVLVDPKEKNFPYYKGVTVITPNRKEAYGGLGDNHPERFTLEQVGQKIIKKLNCRAVLITLGEEGMALFEKAQKTVRIPTAAQEVFDVSGAGDTVMAVFALALASGANLKEAAFVSNLAAGIVVGKIGTATVTPKELIEAYPEGPL